MFVSLLWMNQFFKPVNFCILYYRNAFSVSEIRFASFYFVIFVCFLFDCMIHEKLCKSTVPGMLKMCGKCFIASESLYILFFLFSVCVQHLRCTINMCVVELRPFPYCRICYFCFWLTIPILSSRHFVSQVGRYYFAFIKKLSNKFSILLFVFCSFRLCAAR